MTDNHEFAEKGADYALANYPNSSDSIQTYNGAVEALSLKQLCWNTYGGLGEFKNLFGPSSLMDFNNNEAGRAYESKGYSNNFTAFAAAVTAGKVTTYPSQWSLTYLQNTTYAIYSGTLTY